MGQPAKASVEIDDFPGLLDSVDQRDLPPGGAEVQLNCCSVKIGELQVRLGMREVSFDTE